MGPCFTGSVVGQEVEEEGGRSQKQREFLELDREQQPWKLWVKRQTAICFECVWKSLCSLVSNLEMDGSE